MNITLCGRFRGRLYRCHAVINQDRKIVFFAAEYFPPRGMKRVLVVEPERPVSMHTNPLNAGGRKLARRLQEFLDSAYVAERAPSVH
ncbi:MAG TPA: hypothetical protein PLA65_17935 [Spirochaetota bacterium]|nr:MAG: hypothetical protein BWY96_02575 [Spirochaetes bacterium ADurb.BinA120]HPI13633.1 hypothetical protein [Spirochaetota bacterium]HPN13944.1 hypothetical protein [Spirochaetota bacterium]